MLFFYCNHLQAYDDDCKSQSSKHLSNRTDLDLQSFLSLRTSTKGWFSCGMCLNGVRFSAWGFGWCNVIFWWVRMRWAEGRAGIFDSVETSQRYDYCERVQHGVLSVLWEARLLVNTPLHTVYTSIAHYRRNKSSTAAQFQTSRQTFI